MKYSRPFAVIPALIAVVYVIAGVNDSFGGDTTNRAAHLEGKIDKLQRGPIIDGSFVHNVGNLQMNVTNWGFFGSLPKSRYPMADQPSAQWPAGSGIDYLYAAGIWVGATLDGIPCVSTGYPETEFYPLNDPRCTIYAATEGVIGGDRPPQEADDDADGRSDEDWLNGFDDDGDGKIDEDFGAIGKQMFSCFYTDNQNAASVVWPEHTPMNIQVRQESYQWGEEGMNNFIGVRYYVSNIGVDYLSDAYIGIYADLDAGPREYGSYHMDDQVGYWEGVWCAPKGDGEYPVMVRVGYVYDSDGDNGRTPGYFGIALLGYPISMGNYDYPGFFYTGLSTFRIFRGLQPFENGGEPTNDFERYYVLSQGRRDQNTDSPNDYKILMSTGPFFLPPWGQQEIDFAFVCGEGLDAMLDAAAMAMLIYLGTFYDADKDPLTGVNGRESPVMGPIENYSPDPCNYPEFKVDVPAREVYWSNIDCYEELWLWRNTTCYKQFGIDKGYYTTGKLGKETRVNWVTGSAPPPPSLRLVPGNHMVTLLWDNFSEVTPDPLLLDYDFEGYQIWRADNWHRPYGTTIKSGPTSDLWQMLEIRDIVNGIPPDVDFMRPYSQGGWIYEPLPNIPEREQYIRMFRESLWQAPLERVPCPPGLEQEECDTLEAIARYDLGYEGGRRFYRYVDTEAKNGLPYFYSVVAYDHVKQNGVPVAAGRYNAPNSNFKYVVPVTEAQPAETFDENEVYVVPNPVTNDNLDPWRMNPNNSDLTGVKVEFRNLPRCMSTVRIYTVSGDLVQSLHHDGSNGDGTLAWDLLTRNGQDIGSGLYLFAVDPDDGRFPRMVGKFVVIR
ncbi:MAG TPA: hypothetical protein VMX58_00370 [Patescibacteria group bacterium]|nr:hypothetical protein [Patescibacteria group bacterium]